MAHLKIQPAGQVPLSNSGRKPVIKVVGGDTWRVSLNLYNPANPAEAANPDNTTVTVKLADTQFDEPIWVGEWLNGVEPDDKRKDLCYLVVPKNITQSLRRGNYMFSVRVADLLKTRIETEAEGSFLVEYKVTSDQHSIPYKDGTSDTSGGAVGGSGDYVESVNGKTGKVSLSAIDVGAATAKQGEKADTAYHKPSDGIPKSDLASDVQTSLDKADTALQSAPVTSVNGETGAVQLDASDVGAAPAAILKSFESGTKFVLNLELDNYTGHALYVTENGTGGDGPFVFNTYMRNHATPDYRPCVIFGGPRGATLAYLNDIAPQFDENDSYSVGDLIVHQSEDYGSYLYKCTTAHTGTWNSEHFTKATVQDVLAGKLGNSGNQTLDGALKFQAPPQSGGYSFKIGTGTGGDLHITSYDANGDEIDDLLYYPDGTASSPTWNHIATVARVLAEVYAAVQQIAPAWVSGTTYTETAKVSYNGVVYARKTSGSITSSTNPASDTTNWEAKRVTDLFLPLTGGTMTRDAVIDEFHYVNSSDGFGGDCFRFRNYRDQTESTDDVIRRFDLAGLAPLASPAFTGTPTAPNLTAQSADGQVANKKYVDDCTEPIRPQESDVWWDRGISDWGQLTGANVIYFKPSEFDMLDKGSIFILNIHTAQRTDSSPLPVDADAYIKITSEDGNTVYATSDTQSLRFLNTWIPFTFTTVAPLSRDVKYAFRFFNAADNNVLQARLQLRTDTSTQSPGLYVDNHTAWRPRVTVRWLMGMTAVKESLKQCVLSSSLANVSTGDYTDANSIATRLDELINALKGI